MTHGYLILIGAPKAGTSTLARLLARRDDVIPCAHKEPRFFTDFAARDWHGPGAASFRAGMIVRESAYVGAFGPADRSGWRLDASTDYLSNPAAPARIHAWAQRYPTRLICVLRDPVARIISEYQHTVRDHLETERLRRAMELEPERVAAGWQPLFHHLRRSTYHADVTRYRDLFGDDLLLLDFAELTAPDKLMDRISRFLGTAPSAAETTGGHAAAPRENSSHVYRSPTLARLMRNRRAMSLGRALPKTWRAGLRGWVERHNRTRLDPAPEEMAYLRAALSDDMLRCRADPHIPTASWTFT